MIKLIKLKFILSILLFLSFNSCMDTRISWKAMDLGCAVPSANLAFVEISQIQSTGTTRDFAGIAKYAKYVFFLFRDFAWWANRQTLLLSTFGGEISTGKKNGVSAPPM